MNSLLLLCFAISGATALALEVLWMRSAGLVLGATALTTATVLACYFTGLGFGAARARRIQRRPVRLYGLLELGAGIGAFWSLAVFRALASDPAQAWLIRLGPIGHVTAVSAALFPATLCIGATLPALGQALAAAGSVGRRGGLLYALNTLGGVLGAAVAGFGLPAVIGVRASYGVAAGASLFVGATALIIGDGSQERRSARQASDTVLPVVVSDLFIPWHASAGNLYAREMYETVARRLAPGGLFCQWLPLYQLTREEFDIIVRTFLAVFPQASLWRDDFYSNRPVVGLIGQHSARSVEIEGLRERLRRLPEWSRDALFTSPQGLIMLYAGDLTSVADLFAKAPLNTDDRPLVEFLAPQLTRVTAAGDKDWFIGEELASFYDTLDARLMDTPDPFWPASDEVAGARRAGTALYHYVLAVAQQDDAAAARLQTEVRRLVPEVILAAESEVPRAGLAEAREALVGLRAEQERVHHRLEEMERRLREMRGAVEGPR